MNKSAKLCVILFQGRCGSSWLSSALNQHSQIAFEGEILEELKNVPWLGNEPGWESQMAWTEDFLDGKVLPSIEESLKPEKPVVAGYKTKLSSVLDIECFYKYLHDKDAKIIRLVRANRLDQILSHIRAEILFSQKEQWNIKIDQSYSAEQIEIDIDNFFYINQCFEYEETRLDTFLGRMTLKKHLVDYDELLKDNKNAMDRIYGFLGLDFQESKGIYKKMSPLDNFRYIRNYDQLKDASRGTNLFKFFE
jgi:hypothetical protein